jgi:hypothetical protein
MAATYTSYKVATIKLFVRSIKGNHVSVAYIRLKLISGRYLGLTYKDT